MNNLNISVIILNHRQDESIVRAIESVSFASEIIIIDNNSGMSWSDLKQRFPLKIISLREPITNFSKVRNDALNHAQHDWVLFLDSDEQFVSTDIAQLSELLDHPTARGAVLYRSDVFLNKKLTYGEAGHQAIIRLGKKQFMKFHGTTHEIASIDGQIVYTSIELLHYAHPTISEFIEDVSRYAKEVAKSKQTSLRRNLFELLVYPPIKLFYGLVIQGGFSDGWYGIVYAFCMSLHSLLVRIYRYELLANRSKTI